MSGWDRFSTQIYSIQRKLNFYHFISLKNVSKAARSLVADNVVGVVPLLLSLAVPALAAGLVTRVHLTLGTPNMAWVCEMIAIALTALP